MARLLIVDDEPLILENLYVLFREETDMELDVYKANSAEEALSIMDDVAIDILITDIIMPGMSGLELQARAVELLPNIKVIVLTSYNDFSLIQTAQRKGSIDYIMKTEPEHVLLEAVQMSVAMLDAEILNRRRLSDLKSMQDELTQVSEMFALTHFLETGGMPKQDAPFGLRGGMPAIVLTARTDSGKNAMLAGRMGVALFSDEMNAGYSLLPDGCMVMLLQPKAGSSDRDWSLILQKTSALCMHLQRGFEEDTQARIAVCISEQPIPPQALRAQCDAQRRALEGADPSALLTLGTAFQSSSGTDTASRINVILNTGSREEYRRCIDELTTELTAADDETQRRLVMTRLLVPVFSYMCGRGDMEHATNVADMLSSEKSAREMETFCREMEDIIFTDTAQGNAPEENVVRIIERYAMARMGEDLSLQSIAAMLHYNPVYLSRLFKSVAGINYSTWISDMRLKEAQKQLRRSDVKIQDISEKLGFETPSYFTRFFKRKTGLSPVQWRTRQE